MSKSPVENTPSSLSSSSSSDGATPQPVTTTTATTTAVAPTPPPPPAARPPPSTRAIVKAKSALIAALCSLDRGIAANPQEALEVDELAAELEALGGGMVLSWSATAESAVPTMEKLAGTWRLIYSSGFNSGSLGGRRPGPPAALVPSVLGQVYQRVDKDKQRLDNMVEFLFNYPLPPLPGLSPPKELPMLRIILGHSFEVSGSNTVTITYDDTRLRLLGLPFISGPPPFDLPQLPEALRPPKQFRSASFDVTYLDGRMRITRGDRGELRIYLADQDPEQPVSEMIDADEDSS